jgi:phosphoribosylglycinamide formyltransferase-1
MKRVAVLISGGGSNMVSLVDDMVDDHPCRPVLALSNVPDAGGLEKAKARGIATQVIDHKAFGGDRAAFEAALDAALIDAQPDIICLAGFMRILSADFMAKWAGKMLNIHPSLLPKYRGLHTHQRALDAGDHLHGCTVHEVTSELDGGPILGQAHVAVEQGDTAATLAAKVLPFEHLLYPAVLRRFAVGDRRIVVLGT